MYTSAGLQASRRQSAGQFSQPPQSLHCHRGRARPSCCPASLFRPHCFQITWSRVSVLHLKTDHSRKRQDSLDQCQTPHKFPIHCRTFQKIEATVSFGSLDLQRVKTPQKANMNPWTCPKPSSANRSTPSSHPGHTHPLKVETGFTHVALELCGISAHQNF